jgi:hypothetical protein
VTLTSEERDRAMGLERTPAPRERGVGLVYHGTHVFLHGFVVTSMTDCHCPPCAQLDPWDDERRVSVVVDGDLGPIRLSHARMTSFRKPTTTEEKKP